MTPLSFPKMVPSREELISLRTSVLKIAALEQRTSEAATRAASDCAEASRVVVTFLEELEFLHTSHSSSLRAHADTLWRESKGASRVDDDLAFTTVDSSTLTTDVEEALIAAYTRLNMLAAHYTRLHASAIGLEHDSTAALALRHLKTITPKIMECSQAIPQLAAEITRERFGHVFPGSAEIALEATQAAWKNETHFPKPT